MNDDDVVNNKFENNTGVYNEIVDHNDDDSLKNKFVNAIFPTDGNALLDSVNTVNTVNIKSFGNITRNSNDTGIRRFK